MAWRIDEQVIRGEIHNQTRDRVSGRLWLLGREEPVVLELEGNPWRDIAGHVLKFTNPDPKPGNLSGFSTYQKGAAGDITASRKVKVPECSMEELMECFAASREFPWHWGNSLYLEWFSETNGRVVIETAHYQLEMDENEDKDEDAPTSLEEAQADAEDARMQTLLDRVMARMQREAIDAGRFDQIYEEERTRLMRERGETEREPTPEEVAERQEWIDEMNALAEEAMEDFESEKWKGGDSTGAQRHPFVEECTDLAVEAYRDVNKAGWIPEDAHGEHPLLELINSVSSASAKLAGALGTANRFEEWPPDALIAGDVLVRLKKSRAYWRDALRALDSAEEEGLATPQWRHRMRINVSDKLAETQDLIRDVRESLETGDNEDPGIF
jgi:hypothetical protein